MEELWTLFSARVTIDAGYLIFESTIIVMISAGEMFPLQLKCKKK